MLRAHKSRILLVFAKSTISCAFLISGIISLYPGYFHKWNYGVMMFYKPVNAIAALFISALLIVPANASQEQVPSLHVSGTGTVDVEPDMANVSFGVVREAKTARGALDANNSAMAEVLKALEDSGIEKKDIQTSQFNIQPQYFYPPRKDNGEQESPRITGYAVSNSVAIRIRDLSKTGAVLDQVVTLGVNSGGNISFTNADIPAILEKARVKAVEDASKKAKTLAEAAGVKLVRILEISENVNRPMPMPRMRGRAEAMVASDASVPVAAGENTYQVEVNIRWQIGQ